MDSVEAIDGLTDLPLSIDGNGLMANATLIAMQGCLSKSSPI